MNMATGDRPRVLVVFDYDWSLVNENSDTYIFKQLCPELLDELPTRRLTQPSWTQLMDDLLGELAVRQPQLMREDLQRAVAAIPMLPRMIDALRLAVEQHAADAVIISDANTVYIDSMLDHHGIRGLVKQVHTNHATFENQRLRVAPYHALSDPPHGCEWCPTNMCKGRILDAILAAAQYDVALYVGDGGGDFCPSTRLSSHDTVFARADDADGRSFGLYKRLTAHADKVRANVSLWRTGEDIFDGFLRAIHEAHERLAAESSS